MTQLDALRQYTTVVADTGDFLQMEAFQPQDATTNPSLILKSVLKPEYRHLLDETLARFRSRRAAGGCRARARATPRRPPPA